MHRVEMPNWHPRLTSGPFPGDVQMIATYAYKAALPKATGKRRLSVIWTHTKKPPAAAAIMDAVSRALKCCGYLVDDSPEWVDPGAVIYPKAKAKACTIILEDIC